MVRIVVCAMCNTLLIAGSGMLAAYEVLSDSTVSWTAKCRVVAGALTRTECRSGKYTTGMARRACGRTRAGSTTRTPSTCSRASSAVDVSCLSSRPVLTRADPQTGAPQDQVRKGPTSLTEFEVSLADMYTGAEIDVRGLSWCGTELTRFACSS